MLLGRRLAALGLALSCALFASFASGPARSFAGSASQPSVPTATRPTAPWVGVNVPGLAATQAIYNCDGVKQAHDDSQRVQSVLASLSADGVQVVRFWAFQSYATNPQGKRDWTALDRVVSQAAADHIYLIPVLGNNWPSCDYWPASAWPNGGSRKDTSGWYDGRYQSPYDGYPASYTSWAQEIVSRYAGNSTILAWEILNEPRAASEASADLGSFRAFAAKATAAVQAADPGKPVSLGSLAEGEPGFSSADYAATYTAAGATLLTAHDYRAPDFDGCASGCLDTTTGASRTLQQPFYVGEMGFKSCDGTQQAGVLHDRLLSAINAGASGVLLWSYNEQTGTGACGFEFGPGSPVLSMMQAMAQTVIGRDLAMTSNR